MNNSTEIIHKGRGLDAMSEAVATLRHHATPADQALLDQLAKTRSQLAALTLRGAGAAQPDLYRADLESLEEKVEQLESELSTRRAGFHRQTSPTTLSAIQAALPAGSALIELAVCRSSAVPGNVNQAPRYLAYVLPAQGRPRWADLGEAAIIDRAVIAWRQALRDPYRTDLQRLARAVDDKVMRPVRSILSESPGAMPGETRHLLIAPDGMLNLIPFAALVDERGRYLVERYAISYLTSGRDLLRSLSAGANGNAPLVVANPTFGSLADVSGRVNANSGNAATGDQARDRGPDDPARIFFQPLPGTEREALAIKAMLPNATLILREQATETVLKQSKAPSLLHIATHGFFLADEEPSPAETRSFSGSGPQRLSDLRLSKWTAVIKNPLLRSGLALAGVHQHHNGDDDGLLTAMEAASLNLTGTRLVVLSACDTGMGEVKNGEGISGLRRALVLAESETQVISLWPVSDRGASSLMAGYYRRLLKGEGRGEALRQIQLEMLKDRKMRHPYYWASFIQAGEWATLGGQR